MSYKPRHKMSQSELVKDFLLLAESDTNESMRAAAFEMKTQNSRLTEAQKENAMLREGILNAKTVCDRCEGNGELWADGKAHHYSDSRPTTSCGQCGGSGYIYDIESLGNTLSQNPTDWLEKHDAETWSKAIAICETKRQGLIKAIEWGKKQGADARDIQSCTEAAAEIFILIGELRRAEYRENGRGCL